MADTIFLEVGIGLPQVPFSQCLKGCFYFVDEVCTILNILSHK